MAALSGQWSAIRIIKKLIGLGIHQHSVQLYGGHTSPQLLRRFSTPRLRMQTDLVKQLVSRSVNLNTRSTYTPRRILHDRKLIKTYASIRATPFISALLGHNVGSMKVLLGAGANLNASVIDFPPKRPLRSAPSA
ncbi:hypothetical protein NOR_08434 [Metarhizium rileyi]|uniref:Ankyrin repeat-containing domain protein n=1 Tax=Metarhizium rileyi (strain RCEF 4871) TaxID=1649241 RepID=A0A166W9L4_METRR|nr:hypothetical protein NOR_08434 [Metarhizium rileyi RCEF 4871]